ncbi:unnamed protein product [Oppiella nova]|uniref:Uncharacterized protein n=1 Tax=Oppiella nova TaxID=334625 RepID=A0A7R9LPV6_9ACAR|nr:unnamed protein product [Oppiella nova]CAG2165781.1 unnamed protein product [Oppiella nova]
MNSLKLDLLKGLSDVTKTVDSLDRNIDSVVSQSQLKAMSRKRGQKWVRETLSSGNRITESMRHGDVPQKGSEMGSRNTFVRKPDNREYATLYSDRNDSLIEANVNENDGSSNVEIFADSYGKEDPKVYLIKDD